MNHISVSFCFINKMYVIMAVTSLCLIRLQLTAQYFYEKKINIKEMKKNKFNLLYEMCIQCITMLYSLQKILVASINMHLSGHVIKYTYIRRLARQTDVTAKIY